MQSPSSLPEDLRQTLHENHQLQEQLQGLLGAVTLERERWRNHRSEEVFAAGSLVDLGRKTKERRGAQGTMARDSRQPHGDIILIRVFGRRRFYQENSGFESMSPTRLGDEAFMLDIRTAYPWSNPDNPYDPFHHSY